MGTLTPLRALTPALDCRALHTIPGLGALHTIPGLGGQGGSFVLFYDNLQHLVLAKAKGLWPTPSR